MAFLLNPYQRSFSTQAESIRLSTFPIRCRLSRWQRPSIPANRALASHLISRTDSPDPPKSRPSPPPARLRYRERYYHPHTPIPKHPSPTLQSPPEKCASRVFQSPISPTQ